jgi:hypothetical protein
MYPMTVSDDAKIKESKEAKFKGEILQHEICAGV